MARCVECGRDMHPMDASQWLECGPCRGKLRKRGRRTQTVTSMDRRRDRQTRNFQGTAQPEGVDRVGVDVDYSILGAGRRDEDLRRGN